MNLTEKEKQTLLNALEEAQAGDCFPEIDKTQESYFEDYCEENPIKEFYFSNITEMKKQMMAEKSIIQSVQVYSICAILAYKHKKDYFAPPKNNLVDGELSDIVYNF